MEAATGGGIRWAGEEGSQILAGQRVPAPSCPLTCPPASYSPAPPPGDVEKQLLAPWEPLLLFPLAGRLTHAPGRALAARLLRGPAGRQVHSPQPWRGWGWGGSSCLSQHSIWACLSPVPCTHLGRQGTAPRSQSLGQVGICLASCCQKQKGVGRAAWGPGLAGLQSTPTPTPARTPRTPSPLTASRGVELGNACALFLLLLLNLILTGRQDRLKRREVERRLRGVIGQIQGEAGLGADLQRGQCWNEGRGLMQDFRGSEENRPGSRGACWIRLVCVELRVRLCPTFHLHQMPSGMARRSSGQMPCTQTSTCRSHHPGLCTGPIEMDISSTCRSACWWKETS